MLSRLCNAPATFQRLMQKTLAGLGAFCSVYIDDVIVFSRSLEEHLDHLSQVFSRLQKVGLKLHPSKCQFAFPEVPYLGHIISAKGISPNPDKVRAVRDYPVPTSVRAIREFLGIAGYYRRFIPNFAKVAQPLYHLIKKDVQYMWSSACQEAFTRLKELLTSPPVLAYPILTDSLCCTPMPAVMVWVRSWNRNKTTVFSTQLPMLAERSPSTRSGMA